MWPPAVPRQALARLLRASWSDPCLPRAARAWPLVGGRRQHASTTAGAAGQQDDGHQDQQWETCVGLEFHAQVLSQSKAFSGAPIAFAAAPNSKVRALHTAPNRRPRPCYRR